MKVSELIFKLQHIQGDPEVVAYDGEADIVFTLASVDVYPSDVALVLRAPE